MANSRIDTRNRILEAATQHFSSYGYHGASIREITKSAQVNLAAINYHFSSKDILYCAVLETAFEPINKIRIRKLENAAALSVDSPIPLALVFQIFSEPLFELGSESIPPGSYSARLIGRSMTEPLAFVQIFLAKEQRPITNRFVQAIRPHVPRMNASEFMWRLSFIVGAMHHTLATMHCMQDLTQGICGNNDVRQTSAHFVQFAVNTIQAPTTPD